MTEYFQLLLTLGAVLVVLLGILALITRFILAPLLALAAMPTYAAIIAVEYMITQHNGNRCPQFLQLRKPKAFWKKLCMNFFATYCTVVGGQIAVRLFTGIQDGKMANNNLAEMITHASDAHQFFIIALFWIFLLLTYVVSFFHGDNPDHPINKLEELVIPEWVKKLTEKVTG